MDRDMFGMYKTYFDDTGGLDKRASVKIAGVEVGWVEEINLLEGGQAEVKLMINKKNRLSKNAYAIIQQEGLIGAKNVEIDPGDPSSGPLVPGSTLSMPGKSPASIGDLLDQFRDIASSVHDIALSFRNVFATRRGEEAMRNSLDKISEASESISNFSAVLDRVLTKNEQSVHDTLVNVGKVSGHLDTAIPQFSQDVHGLADLLKDDVLPSVNKNFERLTLAFADDTLPKVSKLSDSAGGAFEKIGEASVHVGSSFEKVDSVVDKIDKGEGLVGKLINEDEMYYDIKKTVRGLKNYVGKAQSLDLYVDMHSETMYRTTLSKGYIEIKIRPSNDYFYQIQLVGDENGRVTRDVLHREYRDSHGTCLPVNALVENGRDKVRFAEEIHLTAQHRQTILFGFQFGKRFNRFAFRVGMFENTFGAALDFYVPLNTDKVHWLSTFEAFDLRGINRIKDTRPHFKWINRVFFLKNLYTAFGIDDFYSKRNASPFLGGGIRFGDDNLKYLMSMLPIGAIASTR